MTRPLLALGIALLLAAGAAAAHAPRPDRFDQARAWALLRAQVAMGPRPAGSAASRRLARLIHAPLPRAHYEAKFEPFRFVGANDGAGGTAELLELARALSHAHRAADAPPLRFVAFDGEESPGDGDFYATGDRGSKAYAARHAHELRAMVLLDFVANKRLRIPRELGSDRALWARLRAAARRVGSGAAFPRAIQGEILDDHTPFADRGIPAIDLIDFDFPCWHRACDDLGAVSEHSLGLSGRAVLELLLSWR